MFALLVVFYGLFLLTLVRFPNRPLQVPVPHHPVQISLINLLLSNINGLKQIFYLKKWLI